MATRAIKKPGAPRKDKGAAIDGYLARINPTMRPVCNALVPRLATWIKATATAIVPR